MIRKVVVVLVVGFLAFWFTGAHLMKGKIVALVEKVQSDNLKISYSDLKIGGFPLKWQITIKHPAFSYIDALGTSEAHFEEIIFNFAFGLKTTHIDLGKIIDLRRVEEEKHQSYRLIADDPLNIDLVTYRRIYEIDDSSMGPMNVVRSCVFLVDHLAFEGEKDQRFDLKDIKFFADKDLGDDVDTLSVSMRGSYNSETGFLGFEKANINTILSYKINYALKEQREFDHKIKITTTQLEIDDARLNLAGELKLNHISLPEGKFEVALKRYKKLVDIIVPQNFFISKSYIKEILAGVIMRKHNGSLPMSISGGNDELVQFDVVFTEDGVKLD